MFKLIALIKRARKKRKCNHNYSLIRWRVLEATKKKPDRIKAEFICPLCGKIEYLYLDGDDKKQWEFDMDDYKKG